MNTEKGEAYLIGALALLGVLAAVAAFSIGWFIYKFATGHI